MSLEDKISDQVLDRNGFEWSLIPSTVKYANKLLGQNIRKTDLSFLDPKYVSKIFTKFSA